MQPQMKHRPENEPVLTPVGDLFQMLSQELKGLSHLLGAMHAPVEPETWRLLAKDNAWLNALQNIDRIDQMLNAISRFLHASSEQCGDHWQIDCAIPASEITLAQLRNRLHPPSAPGAASEHEAGDCEMF